MVSLAGLWEISFVKKPDFLLKTGPNEGKAFAFRFE